MRRGRVGAGTGREDCRGQRGPNGGGREEMEVRNRCQTAKKGGGGGVGFRTKKRQQALVGGRVLLP